MAYFAVVLCLNSVLIGCHGSILFTAPKAEGELMHCVLCFYFFWRGVEKKANILTFCFWFLFSFRILWYILFSSWNWRGWCGYWEGNVIGCIDCYIFYQRTAVSFCYCFEDSDSSCFSQYSFIVCEAFMYLSSIKLVASENQFCLPKLLQ